MDDREMKVHDSNTNRAMSRSDRNSKLYRKVTGKYQDLDNLPLEDNTDEIDIDSLKQLLTRSEMPTRMHRDNLDLDILETRKRNIDNEKVHDINKLLEKARYENKKIREPENSNIINNSKSILETLGNVYEDNFIKGEDKKDKVESTDEKKVSKMEMTREMKNLTKSIAENSLISQVMPDNNLSLEMFSDLKPSENTIVTEPIKDEVKEEKKFNTVDLKTQEFKLKNDGVPFFPMGSSETSDIDIIKEPVNATKDIKKIDNDFFTSSYEFSKKDFTDDDDDDDSGIGNVVKVILLIISIIVFAGVIAYFVLNYGINK